MSDQNLNAEVELRSKSSNVNCHFGCRLPSLNENTSCRRRLRNNVTILSNEIFIISAWRLIECWAENINWPAGEDTLWRWVILLLYNISNISTQVWSYLCKDFSVQMYIVHVPEHQIVYPKHLSEWSFCFVKICFLKNIWDEHLLLSGVLGRCFGEDF